MILYNLLCDENRCLLHLIRINFFFFFNQVLLHLVDDCEDLFEAARGRHITSDLTN